MLGRAGWSSISTQLRNPGPGSWLAVPFLARNPHFSAVLEKQKSAKEKTARQSEGTELLEGVGTVPAEVAVTPSSGWARLPLQKGPLTFPEAGWPGLPESGLAQLKPGLGSKRAGRREGRKMQTRGEPKVPGRRRRKVTQNRKGRRRGRGRAMGSGNPPSPESQAPEGFP